MGRGSKRWGEKVGGRRRVKGGAGNCLDALCLTNFFQPLFEIVGTLQDAWHVAKCLKRFTTLSTNDRVIIFGVGGWGEGGGGGGGGKLLSDTRRHMQLVTRS